MIHTDWWYDFGANLSGDAIDLYAECVCSGDRGQAIRELAKLCGVESVNTDSDRSDDWRDYMQNLGNGIMYWHQQLQPCHRDYLHSRGITDATIDRLCIGYNGGRIIIPYRRNGYFYNWIGRSIPPAYNNNEPEVTPRYFKPHKTEHSDSTPWGMDSIERYAAPDSGRYAAHQGGRRGITRGERASDPGGNTDTLYIAEGSFDAIAIEQSGLPVIATMGGHFPKHTLPSVISLCHRFKSVTLTFDSDPAGQSFTLELARLLFQNRILFRVVSWPHGFKDVSDYCQRNPFLNLPTCDGLSYLASTLADDLPAIERFISKMSRLYSSIQAEAVAATLDTIPEAVRKSLLKTATSAPSEKQIVRELIADHPYLRHIVYVGFYEFVQGAWRKLEDKDVGKMVNQLWGGYATSNRVNSVVNLGKTESSVDANMVFDRKPLWCFANGTLELDTGKFRESRPEDNCSIQVDYPYDPKACNDAWEKFIRDVSYEDGRREDTLQQIAGYVLFTDCRFHKIVMFTGNGRNGKSVYHDVLKAVFGQAHCTAFTPEDMNEPFKRIMLKDSILNIGPDVKPSLIGSEETLKAIAAGNTQQACYKGKDFVSFDPRAKLMFSYNGDLKSQDGSDGMVERLLIVNFPCKFVDDPDPNNPRELKKDINILDKLIGSRNPEKLSGIFNWVYKGYKELMQYKEFTITDEQAEHAENFKEVSNPVVAFCQDFTLPLDAREPTTPGTILRNVIYSRYRGWCDDNGHKPQSRTAFIPNFRRVMGNRIVEYKKCRVPLTSGYDWRFVIRPTREQLSEAMKP